jgi:hypothetical protein
VLVAAPPPAEAEQWAATQPAVASAPKIYPHPYQPQPQPQPGSFRPQSFAPPPEPPPFPAQQQPPQFSAPPPPPPQFSAPPPFPPLPPPHVAVPVVIQPSRVSPTKPPAARPAQQPLPSPSSQPAPNPSGARGKGARADSVPTRQKGKFRETMWFKKGELDEATAAAAAAEGAAEAPAKADDLPIEDRYKDDGTLTAADRERLSLRTGGTQMVPTHSPARSIPGEKISEREMIAELRSGNIGLIVLIIAAVLVIGGVLVYFIALR